MNRSNIGNVVTNGVQILSVGTTTASKFLDRADSALNNMSKEQKTAYYKTQAEKMNRDTEAYNSMTEQEKQEYANRRYGIKDEEEADVKTENTSVKAKVENEVKSVMQNVNSEQAEAIGQKISNDITWIEDLVQAKRELEQIDNVVDEIMSKNDGSKAANKILETRGRLASSIIREEFKQSKGGK